MDVERSVCLLPHIYTPLSLSAAIKSIADAHATSIQMLCGSFTPQGHVQIKTALH